VERLDRAQRKKEGLTGWINLDLSSMKLGCPVLAFLWLGRGSHVRRCHSSLTAFLDPLFSSLWTGSKRERMGTVPRVRSLNLQLGVGNCPALAKGRLERGTPVIEGYFAIWFAWPGLLGLIG
jgi:hypothetical protein